MLTTEPFILFPLHRKYADNPSGQRPPSYSWLYWIGFALLSPFVGVGLFLVGLTAQQTWQWGRFQWEAVATEAIVIKRTEDSDFDGTYYRVDYRYQDERGQRHSSSDTVSEQLYAQAIPDTRIPVRYLRSEPQTSRPGAQNGFPVLAAFLLFFATFWNGIIGFMLSAVVRGLQKEWRWASAGITVPAEVISAEITTDSDGDHFLQIRYCLHSPSGEKIFGDERIAVTDVQKQVVPAMGTPAVAAYLDNHHYRLL